MGTVEIRDDEVEILPGVVGPRRCEITDWVSQSGHSVRAVLRLDEESRRYVFDELTLSREGQPDSGPITTESLRSVAVSNLLTVMLYAQLLVEDSPRSTHLRDLPNPEGREPWGRTPPDGLAAEGPTDRALQWVAQMYRLGALLEGSPTKTVQESLKLSRSTAIRWVMAARDKGYLGEAEVGKAGEKPVRQAR